jgi:YesN/AraC family two-component response regulator
LILFFDTANLAFTLLDVLEVDQTDINNFNKERNFSALSFRFDADTLLKTETQECVAAPNCICYVPAQLNYRRISKKDHMIVVHFHAVNYSTNQIELFYPKESEAIGQIFQALRNCWKEQLPGYTYRCAALMNEILALCYQQNYKESIPGKLQNALRYLEENYKTPDLTVSALAKQAFVSEVYFRKLFKKQYGISPRKYIIKLRMETAMELISTGYYSLAEVAALVGYEDYKYFSTEFKVFTGVSPSRYCYQFPK